MTVDKERANEAIDEAKALIDEARKQLAEERRNEKVEDLKRILSQIEHCEKTLRDLRRQLVKIASGEEED